MATGYDKADFWAKKAKDEGYPARSVYKLQEIDEKFKLFKSGMRVLDLGAAPGSWSIWALKKVGPKGFLCAVDLSPMSPKCQAGNSLCIQADLYAESTRELVYANGPYDLVISDAAPATTGNSLVDTSRSSDLVEAAMNYARGLLKPNGSFVAKLFMGGEQQTLLAALKADYREARAFKPKTCRTESFETYLVGIGYKGTAAT